MAQITDGLIYKFTDKDNANTYTEITGIKEYKITRNKLWKEAKRNMAGELNAVFIGIFPKLEVKIRVKNDDDIKTLINILDSSYLKLKWWDSQTGGYKYGTFYTNDYPTELISKKGIAYSKTSGTTNYRTYYKEFDVHFTPIKRGGNDLSV